MVKPIRFPEEGELVVCTVKDVKNFGAFVSLDEYEGKEGFIHLTEVASGWIKYIRDYVREGQKIVCKVLRVDPSKGHIDLSLKQVNEHQRREKIQQWKNEQKADKLLELVAKDLGKTLDGCYDEFGQKLIDKYGTLYRTFEEVVLDNKSLEKKGFKGDWVVSFVKVAVENIPPPFVKIGGYLELSCPKSDGAIHIKNSLLGIETEGDVKIKVQYIGAPKYRVTVEAPDYKIAEEELKKAAERAIQSIKVCGGEGKFYRKD